MREECPQVSETNNAAELSQSLHSTRLDNEPSYPYDAWILAGGRIFRAHAQILKNHSPYLRASINSVREPRLLLPHIPAGGFAAVLSYMYTGRITLTQAPIYEVLLTAHILQIPALVALCQTLVSTTPNSSSEMMWQSHLIDDLNEDYSFRLSYSDRQLPEALSAWRSLAQLVPTIRSIDHNKIMPNPTLVRPTPTRPIALVAEKQTGDHPNFDFNQTLRRSVPVCLQSKSPPKTLNPKNFDDRKSESSFSSVVIDIAACDGPVFFERVLNKAFKTRNKGRDSKCSSDSDSDSSESEINVVDTADDDDDDRTSLSEKSSFSASFLQRLQSNLSTIGNGSRTYHCVYCNNNFKSHYCYQKHMRRHINPITAEQTENVTQRENTDSDDKVSEERASKEFLSAKSSGIKRSLFCSNSDHKSNIKRKTLINENESSNSGSESQSSSISNITAGSKLKVLDLNVQYFPCKTCGSKFPSYYFVHKHRRLCHNEEDATEKVKNVSFSTSSTNDTKVSVGSNNSSINNMDTTITTRK